MCGQSDQRRVFILRKEGDQAQISAVAQWKESDTWTIFFAKPL